MSFSKKTLRARVFACALAMLPATGAWSAEKPNILVIWGDDIGTWNLSAHTTGAPWGSRRRT